MKIIYLLFILTFSQLNVLQKYRVVNAKFSELNNNNLSENHFIGEWRWSDGHKTLFIKLEKSQLELSKNNFKDIIIGGYTFTESNGVIQNTISAIKQTHSIRGFVTSQDVVNAFIKDLKSSKTGNLTLKFKGGNYEKLVWRITPKEELITDEKTKTNFTLPISVTLDKVK